MPRSKIIGKATRNRLALFRQQLIREFDSQLQQSINAFELKIKQDVQEIDMEINLLKTRIPQKILAMKIGDLKHLGGRTFSDIESTAARIEKAKKRQIPVVKLSKDDEGYLTEDSRGSGKNSNLLDSTRSRYFARTQRNLGPLSSAKASQRRRSSSANGNIIHTKPSIAGGTERISREPRRLATLKRQKAFSADRTMLKSKELPSSPTALLRWPKPGELVVSVSGSPLVAQIVPESFANVNIPIKDGVISLRPKILRNVDPDLVHRIDGETFSQIKLLQSNLELLMSFAKPK